MFIDTCYYISYSYLSNDFDAAALGPTERGKRSVKTGQNRKDMKEKQWLA